MQTPEPTLHDFVITMLSDASCRAAFDHDPVAALSGAGLPDVAPQDVLDAIPLVLDLASASGAELAAAGAASGGLPQAFGAGGFDFDASPQGSGFSLAFDSPMGSGEFSSAGGLDGVASGGSVNSVLGGGGFDLTGGTDGLGGAGAVHLPGLDAMGLDADAIGRGGDAVTGTVAGYLSTGAGALAGALTDGAASLSDGLTTGGGLTGSLVTDGAAQLSGAVQDPTSVHLPTLDPAALPDLPAGLPSVPALPVDVTQLPGDLPQLPDLAGGGLPHLPVDLPHLPVDLPHLPELPGAPALPGLPEAPQLPSLPGLGTVHDTVHGLTAQVPVVGELTDGLDNHLPFGH
ncbi:MAG: IniB N-terminal domain-containing protein [Labedaea sp.]